MRSILPSRPETGVSRDEQARRRPDVTAYTVSELAYGDEALWDEFVRATDGGTFYHLSGWRKIIEDRLHHRTYYLVCEADRSLQAVLPLVHMRSRIFGNCLISLPFLVYGGPVSRCAGAEQAIIRRAVELAHELGVDQLELRNQQAIDDGLHGSSWITRITHATFRKIIDPDPDKNMKAIPRKQRAMIRKGIEAGLTFEIDDNVGRLYRALLECKRNLGTPFFNRRYLQAVKDTFGDDVEILTVVREAQTVCSVMSFRYKDQIMPYYGGGGVIARRFRGNDFMYWCVMEKACREGLRVFDYGRSMIGSGAYNFKRYWGFEPEPLPYQHHLVRLNELSNVTPANPKYLRAIEIWQKLPLPLAGMLGPVLARHLG